MGRCDGCEVIGEAGIVHGNCGGTLVTNNQNFNFSKSSYLIINSCFNSSEFFYCVVSYDSHISYAMMLNHILLTKFTSNAFSTMYFTKYAFLFM